MGPVSVVRDIMVKRGKKILMAMMCFLFAKITYYSLSFRKLILAIIGLLELFVIGK